MIEIFGASDDLIEMRGQIHDEIPGGEKQIEITVGDIETGGLVVGMSYGGKVACWSACIRPIDEDVPIPWPVSVSLAETGYSVQVCVDCPDNTPIDWEGKAPPSPEELLAENARLKVELASAKHALGLRTRAFMMQKKVP